MLVTFMQTLSHPNCNLKIKAKQVKVTREKVSVLLAALFLNRLVSKLNI